MNNPSLESKLGEVVVELKELTSEIKHLIKAHDETKDDVKELTKRMTKVEQDLVGEQTLSKIVSENQAANKRLAYAIIGSVTTVAILGGLAFKFAGG